MSPILFGVVAILVGCSMMGAAISVLVSTTPTPSVASVDVAKGVLLAKSDPGSLNEGFLQQQYSYLDDACTPSVGSVYEVRINATTDPSMSELKNVVFYFKVTKDNGAGNPEMMNSTDLVVRQYNVTTNDGRWNQVDLESYGDYVLGSVSNLRNGYDVNSSFAQTWDFTVQFTELGHYHFDWYAVNIQSNVAGYVPA